MEDFYEGLIQQITAYRDESVFEGKDASKSVQAFINNISFPNTLEELNDFYILEHGCFNVEDILRDEETNWTVPKWAKPGDVVFFMHSKTAIAKITALITDLNKNKNYYRQQEFELMDSWLSRGRALFNKFGGKIFAIGRVSGRPTYEDYHEQEDPGENLYHWKSRLYADIDSVIVLENPIDISEFNDFILVSRGGAITGVFGKQYERLRDAIGKKNRLPRYVRESVSIPIPLREINKENWIGIAGQYRRSFFLEIQFRSFYVDYLLPLLGDQKKIFRECRCVKNGIPDSFVDNVIKINGKYLPVEVKLDINTEKNIIGQVKKYCGVDRCYLKNQEASFINTSDMYPDKVLIIDTNCVYLYDQMTNSIKMLFDLSNLQGFNSISILKEIVVSEL